MRMESVCERVLLEVTGVSIHPRLRPSPPHRDGLVRGRLRVLEGADGLVLHWEPLEAPGEAPEDTEGAEPPDPGYEPDWAVLSPPRPRPQAPGWVCGFRLALGELWGLRWGPPGLRPPFLVLLPKGGPCPCPPPLHFPRGGARKLLQMLGPHLRPHPHDPRLFLVTPPEEAGPGPSPSLVTRLLQGPYAATVGGLSRLLGGGSPRGPSPCEEGAEPEPPFEVIACVRLGPRPSPARGPPVTQEEWGRSHDPEGRSLDPEGLRARIFRGGLSPEVRPQGWRLLLGGGSEDPSERRASYFRMKLQWRSQSPGQLQRNRLLRRYRHRLEKDLARCHGDSSSQQRALMHDVLMTYCMYHFDLGYVHGMSELLPPLLSVIPDEAEAFWGFSSIMELVGSSFGPSQERLKQQLGEVGQLLGVLEPRLEVRGTRRCCSRWLQLRFQPLMGLEGTMRLWEVLWTGLPCPNFLLLVLSSLLVLSEAEEEEEEEEEEGEGEEGDGDLPPQPPNNRDGDMDEEHGREEIQDGAAQDATPPPLVPPLYGPHRAP
ncbi:TBC1 domain family member 17-like [Melopsittacus undulatus]|uniref:TBC1 domain family member 17-like n=1 Tax=Melopsittacus undulatus TaxID=13146 RepID=UPI00146C562A|nr:TBC1 domain family member 17-like [Melopsittacus undulatus]